MSIVAIIALLLISSLCTSNSSDFQALSLDRQISTEGFITISWMKIQSSPMQLQLASDSSFMQLLQKIDLINQSSIHLSGLKNGKYYVRLLGDDARQMSDVVSFQVEHHQLADALKFFVLGAALFIALVAVLIRLSARVQ
jgi:hypothetical protein